jgi:hypothetical protein
MKKKLLLAFVLLAALPMFGQGLYSNGPINGTTDAWTINSGFVVSDTFTVGFGGAVATGLTFGAWAFPGDVLESAEVQITSSEFGGTTYTDQVVNFTQSACSANQYGFNVCTETGIFNTAVNLAGGSYWVNLDNAVVNDGDPIYWDENSGPSSASENSVGTIPSEAFTIGACGSDGKSSPDCLPPPSVPEPGSIFLVGSGMLGVVSLLRLKTYR